MQTFSVYPRDYLGCCYGPMTFCFLSLCASRQACRSPWRVNVWYGVQETEMIEARQEQMMPDDARHSSCSNPVLVLLFRHFLMVHWMLIDLDLFSFYLFYWMPFVLVLGKLRPWSSRHITLSASHDKRYTWMPAMPSRDAGYLGYLVLNTSPITMQDNQSLTLQSIVPAFIKTCFCFCSPMGRVFISPFHRIVFFVCFMHKKKKSWRKQLSSWWRPPFISY